MNHFRLNFLKMSIIKKSYLTLMTISLICFVLQFEPLATFSEWNLSAIKTGQWWRILTGNFTHTNFVHLGMNLAGLWVIHFVFQPSSKRLLLSLVITSLVVGVSLFFSSMQMYVGLSGALHGVFAYLALQEALQGRRSSWLLVVGVIVKVVWEQVFGASVSTSELINARVAIEAHLAGMLAGFIIGLCEWLRSKKAEK
ncbi:rhombosortase [Vibrio aestuarianus]|uniref:Rhombosortase n=1 Tax=Vibrio aestuarianus TaxID=28171 RepID=A0A9X4IZP1_9VIBR|nr:rhombosortase [Vibrio aestuarianus]MDE1310644.1 rhombosortase [Vibrio aestuarianus]MDE1356597.1 rhombosortase [Vibrio aestuarianus]NGZ16853.1 rhombosortase [Vibrio aestuarianus]NGZ92511.1 rhombosortase [Vibrio aestuarianus subsp. cardii]